MDLAGKPPPSVPQLHTQTLFQSPLLRIEAIHCGGATSERSEEEWSRDHEIVFPCSGAFVRHDAFGNAVADPNHVLFLHREQPYRISHPVAGGDRSLTIAPAPAALFELVGEFDRDVYERPDHPFLAGSMVAKTKQRILLYWLIQTARPGRSEDRLLIEEQAFKLLGSVLADAVPMNRADHRLTRTALAHAELVHQAKLVLAARFKEKLSLTEIARAVHSSVYHLCRIFRQETRLTLHLYVVRLRLLGIVEYLAETPHAELTATSLDFGFDTPSHFSSAFRREFGFMPSQLRRPITPRQLREMSKILKA